MPATERAIGLIETRGIVALTAGIEAAMKTADVACIAVERVTSGYLAAAIQGDLAAVRQAIGAASVAVKTYGELRSAQVYPKPHAVSAQLLSNGTREQLRNAAAALTSGGS
jgi:ethanolamine utilization protein EutM